MARTNSPKPTSKATTVASTKAASTRTTRGRSSRTESHDMRWILVPSAILILFGVWMFAISVAGAFSFTFIEPLVILLLVILGLLCAWKIARSEAIHRYTRVVVWFFTILTALASFLWLGETKETCTGIMGAYMSCTEHNRILIAIFLLNPFSLALWAALATSGIAGIFIKPRKP